MILRWTRNLTLLLILLTALGCGARHERLSRLSQDTSLERQRSALSVEFGSVNEKALSVSSRSPRAQLDDALAAIDGLKSRFAALREPNKQDIRRMDALRLHSERINAARKVQGLREACEEVLREAARMGKVDARIPEQAKKVLQTTDPEFRKLCEQHAAAERAYTDASTRLRQELDLDQTLAQSQLDHLSGLQ
jgi:hypothetical protein